MGSHSYSDTFPSSQVTSKTRRSGTMRQSLGRWKTSAISSPFEEAEAVERPEAQDHLPDDLRVRLVAEGARVRGRPAVVTHREEGALRDRVGVGDLRRLRQRLAHGVHD